MGKKRALLSWSSGKDSAWALHEVKLAGEFEVVGLLTTVNETHERVAMHAVRRSLLQAQAASAGIPLWEIPIPWPCSNAEYEAVMLAAMQRAKREDIENMIFGDLYLEDIRSYREQKLAPTGIEPVFPLWNRPTAQLAREMIDGGLVAHITTVDPKQAPSTFVGRRFDHEFLNELPSSVDPCGENGEFHSFVSAGPMLDKALPVRVGECVERDGFHFADLLLDEADLRESDTAARPHV